MFEKVSVEELAGLQTLARRARSELAAAGLPVPARIDPVLAEGAKVLVDDAADRSGGVFMTWTASPRLRECANRAFRLQRLDDPSCAIRPRSRPR